MHEWNKLHKALQPISLSNSPFHEKILSKYSINKKIRSDFPQLLFYRGRSQADLQKIDINFLCSLYLQNNFSCVLNGLEKVAKIFRYSEKRKIKLCSEKKNLRIKNLQTDNGKNVGNKNVDRPFSARKKIYCEKSQSSSAFELDYILYTRLRNTLILDKNKFRPRITEKNSIQKSSMGETFPLTESGFSLKKTTSFAFKRTDSPLGSTFFPAKHIVSTVKNTASETELTVPWLKVKRPEIGSGDSLLVQSTSVIKKIMPGSKRGAYRNVKKLTGTLPPSTSLLKEIKLFNVNEAFSNKIGRDRGAISTALPTLKGYFALSYNSKSQSNSNSEPALSGVPSSVLGKNGSLGEATENLYFFNQQQIDQELQQIKKSISIMEKSVQEKLRLANLEQSNMKRNFEFNRISDQVYRDMEQRIMMEKEMRGL